MIYCTLAEKEVEISSQENTTSTVVLLLGQKHGKRESLHCFIWERENPYGKKNWWDWFEMMTQELTFKCFLMG